MQKNTKLEHVFGGKEDNMIVEHDRVMRVSGENLLCGNFLMKLITCHNFEDDTDIYSISVFKKLECDLFIYLLIKRHAIN